MYFLFINQNVSKMKTLLKTSAFFFCMFLCIGSCDLLYEEGEEYDYVEVTTELSVCVFYAPKTMTSKQQPVQIKVYKEGINYSRKLAVESWNACLLEEAGTYRMREGEIFTASAYSTIYPDVYGSVSITYDEVMINAREHEDGPKTYVWDPLITLIIPGSVDD
jgi:hypothetical protein